MAETSSTSTSAVISTLALNAVICGVFVTCFLLLRLKFKRIYSPKASFDLVREDQRPEELPKDPFSWILILLTRPQSFILKHAGLDGYFFLRYLLVMACVFIGGLINCAVLLPVNITNGNGQEGLDMLSISNVKDRTRYYAHVFVGWVYYGAVVFVFWRELYFYNSLRCAVYSLPRFASKRSSRTILFQTVPDELLDEKQMFKLFNGIRHVFTLRTSRKLTGKIQERANVVTMLENAENKLLTMAVKAKLKRDNILKKLNLPPPQDSSIISDYVPEKKRPTHRANHKKVDTIEWCKERIPELNKEIKYMQKSFKANRPHNSLFVEFENQYYAQMALLLVISHNPMRLQPLYIGYEPGNVIWTNMRLFWWERVFRQSVAAAAVCALVLLWAIPVTFVGVISNITYLTNKIHWLRWILNLPKFLRGLITGMLPSVMLSVLFWFLPITIRSLARVAGVPLTQATELYTQVAYFAFQIINGFIILTLASSATATATQVLKDPSSSMSLLALGFPKSSNFFISFLILQGLGIAGGSLFQVVGLLVYYLIGAISDKTVRKKHSRFSGLGIVEWGTAYPIFTMLTCITLAYSVISPIILLFAAVAFVLVYITYLYNLLYVFKEGPEARGLNYPRAIFQSFTGIYLGQVCLLGIFAVGKGWPQIALQAVGIGATAFIHVQLSRAFDNLIKVIPLDCMRPMDGVADTPSMRGAHLEYPNKVLNRKRGKLADDDFSADGDQEAGYGPLLAERSYKKAPFNNMFVRFFRPDIYLNFHAAREMLPAYYFEEDESEVEDLKHAYHCPDISAACPSVWIPRDPMGCSQVEVEALRSVVAISDENSGFDAKGKIIFTGEPPV